MATPQQTTPRRQPLGAIHNNKGNGGGCSPASNTGGRWTPSHKSSLSNSLSRSAGLKSSLSRSASRASIEIDREGRASLSFAAFEPYKLPAPSATAREAATTNTNSQVSQLTGRSRASTVTWHKRGELVAGPSPLRSPVSQAGPARRTRSKTLSKSQTHRSKPSTDVFFDDNRRHSLTTVESDNVRKCLAALSEASDERLRLIAAIETGAIASNNSTSAAAPTMQRSTAQMMQRSAQPYTPLLPGLQLLSPPQLQAPPRQTASTATRDPPAVPVTHLSPNVEHLSGIISDLQLFLPHAESIQPGRLDQLQTAVDAALGRGPFACAQLGEPIKLGNAKPSFHVGRPPVLYQNAAEYLEDAASDSDLSYLVTGGLFDGNNEPSDVEADSSLSSASTSTTSAYSVMQLAQEIRDIDLQAKDQFSPGLPHPEYDYADVKFDFDNDDDADLCIRSPKW